MIKDIFKDKQFFKTMLAIAIPITVQNLISSSLNMVDTVMVGRLGETSIASVGLANQFFFVFTLLLFGINSGTSIFVSQFWGKKDVTNIRKVLGIAILTGGAISLIFTLGALIAPKFIMSLFSKDSEVILLGVKYLRIVALSYTITAISFSYSFACRSIGKAKLPMYISAVSLGTNTILNYLLIFGKFGFPKLGVEGAAIATLIARIVEIALLLSIIYSQKGALAGKLKELFTLKKDFIRKFFTTTIPVILNEGFWALGMTFYSAAYARISTSAITAVQISNTIQNLFMVMFFGLGNACAVMIGNSIGARNEHKATDYAKKYSILTISLGIVIGIILILASPGMLSLFKITDAAYNDGIRILLVMAVFMAIKVFNILMVVGILRSGGDTTFSALLEIGSVWFIGVPLAWLGALVWKLPVYYVVLLVAIEDIVKAAIGIPRIISKKWVKNVVEHM